LLAPRFFLTLLLLITTVTAGAAITELTPAAPTSATPISITITSEPSSPCAPRFGAVVRNGSSIRLELLPYTDACITVVAPWKATYDLGTFPTGEYTLDVVIGNRPYLATKFVVRNATPAFSIRPFAHVSRSAGPQVDPGVTAIIDGVNPAQLCTFELCPNVKVFFGDVAVQPLIESGRFTVKIPPHAPGLVDMKIVADDRPLSYTSAGAVYFYDRSAAPDLSVWSRVLFPVLDSSAGAFGAQWTTDASIFNGNGYVVEGFNRVDSLQCFDVGCERFSALENRKFEGRNYPRGAALLLPRESVDAFSFASRVRDRGREADDFGAEIPVVRESAMRRSAFRLLDIPVTSAYRSKLRVYVYAPVDDLSVTVSSLTTDVDNYFQRQLKLTRVDQNLAYAELDLQTLTEVKSDRVGLTVIPPFDLPTWAFVNVTNNATQRVTTVSPN